MSTFFGSHVPLRFLPGEFSRPPVFVSVLPFASYVRNLSETNSPSPVLVLGGTKICLNTTIECLLPRQYKSRNILLWLQTLQLRCEQRTFVTAHMNKRDISKKKNFQK